MHQLQGRWSRRRWSLSHTRGGAASEGGHASGGDAHHRRIHIPQTPLQQGQGAAIAPGHGLDHRGQALGVIAMQLPPQPQQQQAATAAIARGWQGWRVGGIGGGSCLLWRRRGVEPFVYQADLHPVQGGHGAGIGAGQQGRRPAAREQPDQYRHQGKGRQQRWVEQLPTPVN
jgi:hypothetical protein